MRSHAVSRGHVTVVLKTKFCSFKAQIAHGLLTMSSTTLNAVPKPTEILPDDKSWEANTDSITAMLLLREQWHITSWGCCYGLTNLIATVIRKSSATHSPNSRTAVTETMMATTSLVIFARKIGMASTAAALEISNVTSSKWCLRTSMRIRLAYFCCRGFPPRLRTTHSIHVSHGHPW